MYTGRQTEEMGKQVKQVARFSSQIRSVAGLSRKSSYLDRSLELTLSVPCNNDFIGQCCPFFILIGSNGKKINKSKQQFRKNDDLNKTPTKQLTFVIIKKRNLSLFLFSLAQQILNTLPFCNAFHPAAIHSLALATPWEVGTYCTHSEAGETEAQRRDVICPKSQRESMREMGIKPVL